MSDWVERSAKAIGKLNFPQHSWDDGAGPALNEYQRDMYRRYARVVMKELRDLFAKSNNSSFDLAADALDEELKP